MNDQNILLEKFYKTYARSLLQMEGIEWLKLLQIVKSKVIFYNHVKYWEMRRRNKKNWVRPS